jgi:hypothetical protein
MPFNGSGRASDDELVILLAEKENVGDDTPKSCLFTSCSDIQAGDLR